MSAATDSQAMVDLAMAMLRLVLLSSLPAVGMAALVGLVVGIAQAVTQLQDQAFAFGVKFLLVAAAMALSLPWIGRSLDGFMKQIFDAAVRVS